MISLRAVEIKDFMEKLFKSHLFDDYNVSNVDIATFTNFNITGTLNKQYFDTGELETLDTQELIQWCKVKNIVFTIIKGQKPPLSLKIIFSLPPEKIHKFIAYHHLDIATDQIDGLFLNIKYSDNILTCTTGTSLKIFTLDKTIEQLWDDYTRKFFTKNEIIVD
ncbi:hypothetical protein EDC19_2391 [Natranaerovirga hydrolytica]|uniref:Uncharacterized protein n=1 Tax=Natranaerovirga hydrolytica TaxID=680378 RepID=A0A4R1MFU7_9FIRM|nr:DUF5721 family protein [Natranaerovirga hydrolytica]TCK90622.1 hypothetical protein EDC19_2391 [Natranaerovirga hydrolytica]